MNRHPRSIGRRGARVTGPRRRPGSGRRHAYYLAIGFPPAVQESADRMRATANQLAAQGWDVTVVDHLLDGVRAVVVGVQPERYEVVANYLSHARNRRVRVITQVPADDPQLPSLVDVYPGANFPEREVFDMYGIEFTGHPDMTRILMPDDWIGHPLRKDNAPARVPVTFKGDPSPR